MAALEIQKIQEVFRQQNCILLSGQYKDCYTKLQYICQCGQLAEQHLNGFKKGKRCGYCNRKTYSEDLDQRRDLLVTLPVKFTHSLQFKCSCGEADYIPHIHSSKIFQVYVCPKCDIRKARHSSEYNNWKFAVRANYNSVCQCCRSLDLPHVHHIRSRQAFPDMQFIVSNGIVLCFECHMQLHMLYGNETTELELAQFIQKKSLGTIKPTTIAGDRL